MFKQRLITSLFIFLFVYGLIFVMSPVQQLCILGLILAICLWEWFRLIPLQSIAARLLYGLPLLVLLVLIGYYGDRFSYWYWVIIASWGLADVAIVTYPKSQKCWGYPVIVAVWGYLVFASFLHSTLSIAQSYENTAWVLMFSLVLVWAADVGAYLMGKCCGRRKLIPDVSPGKSWEGALGGLTLSIVVGVAGYYFLKPQAPLYWWLGMMVLFVQSVFGDLFISMLKRRVQIKDTGCILPGHGGMLDRLDSLLAVMPVAYIVYHFAQLPLR